jgi:hypothetical protein
MELPHLSTVHPCQDKTKHEIICRDDAEAEQQKEISSHGETFPWLRYGMDTTVGNGNGPTWELCILAKEKRNETWFDRIELGTGQQGNS